MIAEKVFGSGEPDFRWRGEAVARVEGLSDSVFALALTLLMLSLEAPKSYEALIEIFVQVPVFAACFAVLMMFWFYQFRFHRRFGLEDVRTLLLNALLLFLVLLYVYPVRFLASYLYNVAVLHRPIELTLHDAQTLMIIYGLGAVLIYGVLAALYAHAWSQRLALQLDSIERVQTKAEMHGHLLSAGLGAVSVTMAASNAEWTPYAGWIYFALGPLHGVHGWLTRRAIERFRDKLPGAPMP